MLKNLKWRNWRQGNKRELYLWGQSSSFTCKEATLSWRSVAFPQTFMSIPSSPCSRTMLQRAEYFHIGLYSHLWQSLLKGVLPERCYPEIWIKEFCSAFGCRENSETSQHSPLSLPWMASTSLRNGLGSSKSWLTSQSCRHSQHHSLRLPTSHYCSNPSPARESGWQCESLLFPGGSQCDNWGNNS